MRSIFILFCTVVLLVTAPGCAHRPPSEPPSDSQAKTVSKDGYTWKVGAVKVDGSNVPLNSVEVQPAK